MLIKKQSIFFLLLLIVLCSTFQFKSIQAQENDYVLFLKLKKSYGFRGGKINLTAYTDYSSVTIKIYDPLNELIYNQTWLANESRLLPISESMMFGEYKIVAEIPMTTTIQWFTVVDKTGFESTAFPFLKTHKDIEYQIYSNKTLRVIYKSQRISIHLPDLPSGVTISCFNNSQIFVAKFKSAIIDIDLNLVFIHEGCKLIINGTSNSQKDFKFKFYSPQQILKFSNKIRVKTSQMGHVPNILFFDWSDLVKAKEHLSYNVGTHMLTVYNVPKKFVLDPFFGHTTLESSNRGFEDKIKGGTYNCSEAGTADSITVGLRVTTATHNIKCALYYSNNTYIAATEEKAVPSGTDGWVTFNFITPKPSWSSPSEFYIVAWSEAVTGLAYMKYTSESAGGLTQDLSYASFPDPLSASVCNDRYSIYCNYTLAEPTVGSFSASEDTVESNEIFTISATINDVSGVADFVNTTLELSHNVILKWLNSTNAFSVHSDTNGYCFLRSGSERTTVNTTAYTLTWRLSLYENYTEGSVDVVAANTKVYDNSSYSGSGSYTGLFTFQKTEYSPGSGGPSPPPEWEEEPEVPWGETPIITPTSKPVVPMPFELGIAIIVTSVLGVAIYSQVRKPKSLQEKMKQKTTPKRKARRRRKTK